MTVTSSSDVNAPRHPLPARSGGQPPNPVALRLGYLGLVPFVLGALLALLIRNEQAYEFVVQGLAGYAALVISFLGGIHWGLGMRANVPSPTPFAWGVAPSILAWIALLMPAHASLFIDSLLLVGCYLMDRRVYPAHGLGGWLTLRFRLTVVAVIACLLGVPRV